MDGMARKDQVWQELLGGPRAGLPRYGTAWQEWQGGGRTGQAWSAQASLGLAGQVTLGQDRRGTAWVAGMARFREANYGMAGIEGRRWPARDAKGAIRHGRSGQVWRRMVSQAKAGGSDRVWPGLARRATALSGSNGGRREACQGETCIGAVWHGRHRMDGEAPDGIARQDRREFARFDVVGRAMARCGMAGIARRAKAWVAEGGQGR